MATIEQRMEKHTDRNESGGCWPWTAYRTPQGYGQIRVDGRTWRAHRFAWTLANGSIPEGMMVLHDCDHPSCVNPAHLHLGTRGDNNRERCERGRNYNAQGEANSASKLVQRQILEIRTRYAMGNITYKELGYEHGVSRSTIGAIVRCSNWVHI